MIVVYAVCRGARSCVLAQDFELGVSHASSTQEIRGGRSPLCLSSLFPSWAQFAKRDVCYYNHASVKQADAFLITVCITASPEKPRMMKPVGHTVPTHLVQAIGSLLDDPDHRYVMIIFDSRGCCSFWLTSIWYCSDIVFHLISQRRSSNGRSGPTESIKKIYAIKKILAARSEYFSDMFEGGFAEGEQYSTGGDDSDDSASSPPALDHSRPSANRAAHADGQEEVEEDYDYDYQNDTLLHDSDEELEESLPPASSNRMSPRISSSAQASYDHASDNDEELDDDDFRGDDYGGATMNTSRKLSNVFEDATDAIGIPQASLPSSQPSANDTAELRSPMAVDGDNNLRTSVNAVTAGASLPSNVATLSGSGAGIDATDAMDATASPVTPTKVKSKRTRVRGRDVGGENAQRFDRRKRRKVVSVQFAPNSSGRGLHNAIACLPFLLGLTHTGP